ncbi:MAG TPA: PD-(D/E)XK nuclease family transposase [Cyclobacteriaceae bacterium]
MEVQNSKEYDYFYRMAFGTSKVISQHIKQGEPPANIKKVISITIAYFDLGQGEDYVYHGTNQFKGIHKSDILTLADEQAELYRMSTVHEIFPEYWIIKAEKFNNNVEDKLDEWIYFLKNSEVRDDFTAKGLDSANVKLDEMKMTEEEKREYQRYLKHIMNIASENHTKKADIHKLSD